MNFKNLYWLAGNNILLDESVKDFFIVHQNYIATELLSDKGDQHLLHLLRQRTALVRQQGSYFLWSNFSVLLVLSSEKHLRKYGHQKLQLFNPRELKNKRVNLMTETLSLIAELSRSRTALCHANIFKILKNQLSKDEWLGFHGKHKFLIADYLECVDISQSTFDRSRGRGL